MFLNQLGNDPHINGSGMVLATGKPMGLGHDSAEMFRNDRPSASSRHFPNYFYESSAVSGLIPLAVWQPNSCRWLARLQS